MFLFQNICFNKYGHMSLIPSSYYSTPSKAADYCNERVCLYVCLSVRSQSHLRNDTSKLCEILGACGMTRSSSSCFAIRYVLPVCGGRHVWQLPIIVQSKATHEEHLFKVTHQEAASDRGRSLMSMIASIVQEI